MPLLRIVILGVLFAAANMPIALAETPPSQGGSNIFTQAQEGTLVPPNDNAATILTPFPTAPSVCSNGTTAFKGCDGVTYCAQLGGPEEDVENFKDCPTDFGFCYMPILADCPH